MSSDKTTARIVGALFLAAILAYGSGTALVTAVLGAPDPLVAVVDGAGYLMAGAVLMLTNSLVVAAIGVLLHPVLRRIDEPMALGYLVTRVLEATLLAVGVVSLMMLVPIGQEYAAAGMPDSSIFSTLGAAAEEGNDIAYQVAMAVLGVGSLLFCALLYRSRLVPRFLSIWGFVGYAALAAGAVCELFGSPLGVALSVPGGLFEVVLGFRLMIKGFEPSAVAAEPVVAGHG